MKVFRYTNRTKILKDSDLTSQEFFYGESEQRPLLDAADPEDTKDEEADQIIQTHYDEDTKQGSSMSGAGGRVFIFPTLQIPSIDLHEDEETLQQLLNHMTSQDKFTIDFATGYFNPTDPIAKAL